MFKASSIKWLAFAGVLILTCAAVAQKKPLDASVYDSWKSVQGTTISDDGKWILYRIVPQEGDAVVEIKSSDGSKSYTIDRGSAVSMSQDGKFVIATVIPPFAETREAKRKKTKPEDMPKNALVILNLSSGEKTTLNNVTSFVMAEDDSGWIVYKPEPPKPEPAKPATESKPAAATEKKDEKPKKKADHKAGDPVVLRDLSTGKEERIENVSTYRFSKDGKVLVYAVSTKDGAGDGVIWYDLPSAKRTTVVTQLGRYSKFTLDEHASRLAFMTDKDDYAATKPGQAVYVFTPGTGKTELVAKEGTAGVPSGWWIPDSSPLSLSDKGDRVIFGTAPKPAEEKKDETPDDEKVNVDVWNWKDPTLQPQQLLQASSEKNRTYTAVGLLNSGNKVVQLATKSMPSVQIGAKGEAAMALGSTGLPYQIEASWDTGYDDLYLVDVSTGAAQKIVSKVEGFARVSPTGKYAYVYDQAAKTGTIIDMATGNKRVVTSDLPPIWDELNDVPGNPGDYGVAGWTPGDNRILIYDAWDIWSVDPTGKSGPVNVTNGYGRSAGLHLRYVDLDPDEDFVDPSKPIYLQAMDERTKAAGFFWDGFADSQYPAKVLMADKLFVGPVKAKKADTVFFQRMDFDEYADVWLADNLNLQNARKLSNANPQQAQYNWGKAELVSWTSNDGAPLQGILIKPEDFDYSKKYPMIVYFYERNADTLHQYRTPSPTASILNPTMAASNGYIVFIPDIVYKEGYPGESAISCVMPGVQEVVRRGYVDPKRMGIDGQSWGGYQVAYMITETDMFACAYAGAPVVDMFSAYGGIRWGSGLVREFQYEKGQSRIGGALWDQPIRFLENSPLFFLNKVKTPTLIMANDKDGAVPWYQGIEMFTGLRRLQKPAWLLVYNDEDHNLVQRKNRKDLSIRKQQFYDHYLKGAPMPLWMSQGIPATEKGKNYGFELEKKG